MSINPINTPGVYSTNSRVDPSKTSADSTGSSSVGNQAAANSSEVSPAESTDSGKVANPIAELPELRPEVVAAAKARVNSGFYQSRDAALQTAQAILN